MRKTITLLFILIACVTQSAAQQSPTGNTALINRVYQWETDIDVVPGSDENNPRRAFLWIPPTCKQLKGLIVCGHNQIEEGILEDPLFRNAMTRLDFGELWITSDMDPSGVFNVHTGAQEIFNEATGELADVSGYEEIKYVPIVYLSHSSQASQPWNFGAWNPERTLAMISFHGDSPRSTYLCCNRYNPNWEDRNIDGIPGLISIGEEEWNEFRIEDSFKFMKQYPGSVISLLCNAGRGHSDFSQDDLKYLVRFIEKAAQYRMPNEWDGKSVMPLKKLHRKDGWLADRWHKNALPSAATNFFDGYVGNKDSAYWYFDEEMARWTESIYTRQRNKKKQYLTMMQNGRILKPDEPLEFFTDGHNADIHARVVFTDSSYTHLSEKHTIEPIIIKRYAGPVHIVNDTTFRLSHYRIGPFHRGSTFIGMFAFAESDMFYGHAIRQISWKMPARLTEGKPQELKFQNIPDVQAEVPSIKLKATSTAKLPVQYYVRSGPAYIDGDTLVFTKLPPKAKYPVKVTVVAWQYGSMGDPKIQTAEPVEQIFYLNE